MHPNQNTCTHEPFGITSSPVSALAAIGDVDGGYVVVLRTPEFDNYEHGMVHQAYTMRVLDHRALSIGSDKTLRTGALDPNEVNDRRHDMLRTALAFLESAAQTYASAHDDLGGNPVLFSARITEWAHQNSDALAEAYTMLDDYLGDL